MQFIFNKFEHLRLGSSIFGRKNETFASSGKIILSHFFLNQAKQTRFFFGYITKEQGFLKN